MTLFTSTQPSLKTRVIPKFPVNVLAGAGVTITKVGNVYTFSVDAALIALLEQPATLTIGDQTPYVPTYLLGVQDRSMDLVGDVTVQSANEMLIYPKGLCVLSASPASYIKAGIFSWMVTEDPSAALIFRECVGGWFRGETAIGNTRVRGSLNQGVVISLGSDGFAVGAECNITNFGTSEPTIGIATSKYNIQAVSAGSAKSTAGLIFTAELTAGFYNWIYGDPATLDAAGYVLNVPGSIQIPKDGSINIVGSLALSKTGSVTPATDNVGALGTTAARFASVNAYKETCNESSMALTSTPALNSNITVNSSFARITGPSGVFSVGGFASPLEGQLLTIYNSTANAMTIVNEDVSSTAANRIKTLTGANVVLRAGTSAASFRYSSHETTPGPRWILVGQN